MISYKLLYNKVDKIKMISRYASLNNVIKQVHNINLCIKQKLNYTEPTWIGIINNMKCSNLHLKHYKREGLNMIITYNNTFNTEDVPIGYIKNQINVKNGDYIKIVYERHVFNFFNIYYILFFSILICFALTKCQTYYEYILKLFYRKRLKHIKYKDTMNDSQCTICIEEFLLNEKICILECKHMFHINCLDDWITTKKANVKCPNCNSNIVTYSPNEPLLNRLSDA